MITYARLRGGGPEDNRGRRVSGECYHCLGAPDGYYAKGELVPKVDWTPASGNLVEYFFDWKLGMCPTGAALAKEKG